MLARKRLTDLPSPGGLRTSYCFECLSKEATLSESEVGLLRCRISQLKQGQPSTQERRAIGAVAQRQGDGRGHSGITPQLVKIGQRDVAYGSFLQEDGIHDELGRAPFGTDEQLEWTAGAYQAVLNGPGEQQDDGCLRHGQPDNHQGHHRQHRAKIQILERHAECEHGQEGARAVCGKCTTLSKRGNKV